MKRRDFLKASVASASALSPETASPEEALRDPDKPDLVKRCLLIRETPSQEYILYSDSSPTPRHLIKPEALDKRFGAGTYTELTQPDHWRMIDAGLFEDADLFLPSDPNDPAYGIWLANYRPEVEAHDLLYRVFREQMDGPHGGYIPEFGLGLAEHPSTPRYATAKLNDLVFLPRLIAEVATRTHWIRIDDEVSDQPDDGV